MAKRTEPKGGKPAAPRAAIVTGGASGIGLACAERLRPLGWRVALFDRDEAALARARVRLGKDDGIRIASVDITDEPAAEAAIRGVASAFGRLDGVVNSAGIATVQHVFDTPIDLFRKILDVNVVGTFIVARAAARIMRDQRSGSIVNIASISGLRGSRGRSAYGASKGAVVTMTQVMAVDLARFGIRVNAVAPGPIDTPMVQALHDDTARRVFLRHVPMRRYGTADEIARAVAFLLDEEQSAYITGEIIAIDGGFRGGGVLEPEENL
jgi:NAD(P)-dependent dehydrogenase (short-subunit alcohol dehydrogenase family)